MNLEDRYKSLGIDRDAITRACADPVSTSVGKEQECFQKPIGKRYKPPIEEDLSRFAAAHGKTISKRLRKK
mgnify:FL=1